MSCPSAKPHASSNQDNKEYFKNEEPEKDDHNDLDQIEEEEDPYNLCPEDIYDTVDANSTYNPVIMNRPPAPIPRPEAEAEPEKPMTYISRGIDWYFFPQNHLIHIRFHKSARQTNYKCTHIFDSIFR